MIPIKPELGPVLKLACRRFLVEHAFHLKHQVF
jgi:hypothetical protein